MNVQRLDELAAAQNRLAGFTLDAAGVPEAVCFEQPPTPDFDYAIRIPMEVIASRLELLDTLSTQERAMARAALQHWQSASRD